MRILTILLSLLVSLHPAVGEEARNVLLVTLDTTRADRLGCYGHDRDTTPNIDAVAADGVLFSRAYSVVPLTTPSHVSIMTGLHPLHHGVYRNSVAVPDELVTMAELLDRNGYATGAFVSSVVLGGRGRIDDGFDEYSEVIERPPEARDGPRQRMRSADRTVSAALDWLARHRKEKFFLWVHLYEPHLPYLPPDEYGRRYNPGFDEYKKKVEGRISRGQARREPMGSPIPAAHERDEHERPAHPISRARSGLPPPVAEDQVESMKNAYDGEIAFADAQLGRVLEFLRRAELYDKTVILIMGDHGEILHEKQQYFGHHHLLYEGSLRIPLVCRFPGLDARAIDQRITNLDVLPTLLDALSVDPVRPMDGISYWNLIRDGGKVDERPHEILVSYARRERSGPPPETLFEPTGLLQGRWKLLVTSVPGQPESTIELFDLETDPGERRNLCDAGAEPPIARRMRATLEAVLEYTNERRTPPTEMDPETEERLRSLGYVP